MLGRGINEVKKVQREINTEIHRYSSEIEKETGKMQSEIDDIKKQVAQNNKPQNKGPQNKGPRPDPYEEALANDPAKQPQTASPEQDRADRIRESMGDPKVKGEKEQKQKQQNQDQDREQDHSRIGDEKLPQPEDEDLQEPGNEDLQEPGNEDLPYPYNRKKNRDSVD
jgi:hypothetical protein